MITYIAEVGSNHCGSFDLALAHIRVAKEAGATGVKFQLFRAESLDSRPEVQEKLRPYELPLEWLPLLREESHALGLQFGVPPFAIDLVKPLHGLVDFVKISAYDLTYNALIIEAATLGVPIVLSTAMATTSEVQRAWQTLYGRSAGKIILLHGTAAYPAQLADANLHALLWLKDREFPYGLSDHTTDPEAAMLAVGLGATWIEKHFRINCPPQGFRHMAPEINEIRFFQNPDFEVSASPTEFARMISACKRASQALGTGEKNGPLPCEMELYTTIRRSNSKPLRG